MLDALNGVKGKKGRELNLVAWRDARNSTLPQRAYLDLLTAQGPWVGGTDPLLKPRAGGGRFTPFGLYGGAGFGGKSFCLRTAIVEIAARNVMSGAPGQWGTLFCVEYEELKKRQIVEMLKDWEGDGDNRAVGLGQLGTVQLSNNIGWHFRFHDPRMGGVFLKNIPEGGKDPSRKQKGGNVVYILVDELTELNRAMFDAIVYPLRSNMEGVRCLPFGGVTNPDGIGHAWVKKLWIERDFSGESRLMRPDDFRFVQAMAWDNPTFDESVAVKLAGNADPMLVKARWEGSWDLNMGARFSQYSALVHDFEWEDFEATYGGCMSFRDLLRYPGLFEIYASMDYGTSPESATAYYLHAVDPKCRVWTFAELYLRGMFLDEQAEAMLQFEQEWGVEPAIRFCDPSLRGRESDGINRWSKFANHSLLFQLGNNDRVEGWATMDKFLRWRMNKNTGERLGPLWRVHRSCRELRRFLSEAPRDERKMEDIARSYRDDHPGDSARYFFHSYFGPPLLQIAAAPDQVGIYSSELLKALETSSPERVTS